MKFRSIGYMFGVMVLSAGAQEVPTEANDETTSQVAAAISAFPATVGAAALPEGVTTEQNPLKVAYIQRGGSVPAVFRPSPNMPEIVNEDMLKVLSKSGGEPSNRSEFMGYMPKPKVLPCAKGCEGADYEKAVKEFIRGYTADAKHYKQRGEFIVQVRWFNVRPFLQRQLPYGADVFGVSFMLEGKVVSMGRSSGIGKSISAHELAANIGARIGTDLIFGLGLGVKPPMLLPEGRDTGLAASFMNTTSAINSRLGVEDVRPRIEPATEAHAVLMPAIDGIKPNEIEPLDKMYYLDSLKY